MLNRKGHHIPCPALGETNDKTMIITEFHVGILNCELQKHLIMHLIENNESNNREHASVKVRPYVLRIFLIDINVCTLISGYREITLLEMIL